MAPQASERVAELHRLLLETEDGQKRAQAHLELGRLALRDRRVDIAIRHLREALWLDPKLETARQMLRGMGVGDGAGKGEGPRVFRSLRKLVRRWRGLSMAEAAEGETGDH